MKLFSCRRLYTVSVLSLMFSFCMVHPQTVHAAASSTVILCFGTDTSDTTFHLLQQHLRASGIYTITMEKGRQYQLPNDPYTASSPSYSSNKKNIATVDSNGTITAHKIGRAMITIQSGSVSVTCRVWVKKSSVSLCNPSIDLFHCR